MRDVQGRLAAERTFLAWLRTAISIMAFGFVVARFDWFLYRSTSTTGTVLGAVLTASGGLFAVLAAARFWRAATRPARGSGGPGLALAAGGWRLAAPSRSAQSCSRRISLRIGFLHRERLHAKEDMAESLW